MPSSNRQSNKQSKTVNVPLMILQARAGNTSFLAASLTVQQQVKMRRVFKTGPYDFDTELLSREYRQTTVGHQCSVVLIIHGVRFLVLSFHDNAYEIMKSIWREREPRLDADDTARSRIPSDVQMSALTGCSIVSSTVFHKSETTQSHHRHSRFLSFLTFFSARGGDE